MVRYLGIAVICAVLSGCGGDGGEKRPVASAAPGHPARPAPGRLLAIQRLGGKVATSETLTVDRNGAATLDGATAAPAGARSGFGSRRRD